MPVESQKPDVLESLDAFAARAGRLMEFASQANVSDYLGPWAIHDETFSGLVANANGINLRQHIESDEAKNAYADRDRAAQRGFDMTDDGIAIFRISGPMMKSVSSMSAGTSTIRMRQQIRAARKDPAVRGGLMVLDTPGGTVKGNDDLAREVKAFSSEKPLFAFAEDLVASAGVSIASQATRINANNATALYGSMGTYSVLFDQSKAADKLGVKVHVVRAGEFKGMGEPGSEITEAHLQEMQRIVDALNENYLQLIADGRGMSLDTVRALADGRIHPAQTALEMGLVDGIATYEETYRQLLEMIDGNARSGARSSTVGDAVNTTQKKDGNQMDAATLQELKDTFPTASSDWILSQLETQATLQSAALAYATHVQEQAAASQSELQKQLDEERAKNTAGAVGSVGVQPLVVANDGEFDGQSGDSVQDFHAAVRQAAGPNPDRKRRMQAIRTVARKDPKLYLGYLLSTNQGRKQQRQITEKLEDVAAAKV